MQPFVGLVLLLVSNQGGDFQFLPHGREFFRIRIPEETAQYFGVALSHQAQRQSGRRQDFRIEFRQILQCRHRMAVAAALRAVNRVGYRRFGHIGVFLRRFVHLGRALGSQVGLLHRRLGQQQENLLDVFFFGAGQNLVQTFERFVRPAHHQIAHPAHALLRLARHRLDLPPFLVNHFRRFKRVQRHRHFQRTFRDDRVFGALERYHIGSQRRTRIALLQCHFAAEQGKYRIGAFDYAHAPALLHFPFFRGIAAFFLHDFLDVLRRLDFGDGIVGRAGRGGKQHQHGGGNGTDAGIGEKHKTFLCLKAAFCFQTA